MRMLKRTRGVLAVAAIAVITVAANWPTRADIKARCRSARRGVL